MCNNDIIKYGWKSSYFVRTYIILKKYLWFNFPKLFVLLIYYYFCVAQCIFIYTDNKSDVVLWSTWRRTLIGWYHLLSYLFPSVNILEKRLHLCVLDITYVYCIFSPHIYIYVYIKNNNTKMYFYLHVYIFQVHIYITVRV